MANAMTFSHRLEELTDGVTVFRDGVGKPMPLISTDFDVEISSGLAIVVVTRKFRNSEDVPIEAVLTMPVGFNAVVTGLSAQIDGRKLRAIAQSKTAARACYEGAIDSGKMAVLHEEVLRGIHILLVGQLAPGKEVSVEIRTVLPLTLAGANPFLRIPVTTGQLYGATPLQPADDLITDRKVKHVASLQVRTDTGVAMLGGAAAIERGQSTEITLNKAIELVVVGGKFGSLLGTSANGHQVRLDLRPTQGGVQPLKLAVLVDCSGSTKSTLGGRSTTVLGAMKRGLAYGLSTLQEDDYVALWQFSDECQRLGTGAGREVLQLLKKLNQPSGGTNLGSAIQKVAATGVRDILVLTDGQTWDKLHPLAVELNVRVSAVLVGKGSLDANIGHFCAMTGGDLYYAPNAKVAPAVRLALKSNRSNLSEKLIVLEAGRPIAMSRTIGGVDVSAIWSNAAEVGTVSDIGQFAAGLSLSMISETEAEALAVIEGLCSHLTSLVLVDEVGEKAEGVPETRKVPLMAEEDSADELFADDGDGGSQLADFLDGGNATLGLDSPNPEIFPTRTPHLSGVRYSKQPLADGSAETSVPPDSEAARQAKAEAIKIRNQQRKRSMRKVHAFLKRFGADEPTQDKPNRYSEKQLSALSEGIDWEGQAERFSEGNFDGLLDEERSFLDVLVVFTSNLSAMPKDMAHARIVLLAYLALHFVTHSTAARAFASQVFPEINTPLSMEIDGCLIRRVD